MSEDESRNLGDFRHVLRILFVLTNTRFVNLTSISFMQYFHGKSTRSDV